MSKKLDIAKIVSVVIGFILGVALVIGAVVLLMHLL